MEPRHTDGSHELCSGAVPVPRRPGWGIGTFSAEGQLWGKKVQNWVAYFGNVNGHGGTRRSLKIWL